MADIRNSFVGLGLPAELANLLGRLIGISSVQGAIVGDVVSSAFKVAVGTSDGADNASLKLSGGGDTTVARSGVILLYGNESAGAGGVEIYGGAGSTGYILLSGTGANGFVVVKPNSVETWRFSVGGNLTQNVTDGGNIVLTKASTAVAEPYTTGITAEGTVIGDATALTSVTNVITTAAASTGVKLWDAPLGSEVFVYNGGANTVNVWPTGASDTINGGSGGAAITIAAGKARIFKRLSATAWYSMLGA